MTVSFSNRVVRGVKILLLAAIVAIVGWNLYEAWREIDAAQLKAAIEIDWGWALLPPFAFACLLFTNASVWLWLLRRIEPVRSSPQLYGAFFFSQMGKYVPGKITLLLMRLERTRRQGVDGYAVTLSTIVENATYMISGAVVGVLALLPIAAANNGPRPLWLLGVISTSIFVLLVAINPAVLYRLVNPALRKLGRPEIAPDQRLSMGTLLMSSVLMLPCWFFGGFALWATVRCLMPVHIMHIWGLMSAFALSVVIGMISFLPGGLGAREVVQGLFLLPIATADLAAADGSHAEAKLVIALAVVLQRVFQVAAEAGLGLLGGLLTASMRETHTSLQGK